MVSYKELFEKTKEQLKELESNSIDLRGQKVLSFAIDKWTVSVDNKHIILEKYPDIQVIKLEF